MHLLGASQHLHFGAQDNDWEVNHAVRLGLPLAAYRLLWVSLGEIPPTPFDIEKKKKVGSDETKTRGTSKYRLPQSIARQYLQVYPGPDGGGPNVALHGKLKGILQCNSEYSDSEVNKLFNIVTYRLGAMHMHEANYLRQVMANPVGSIFHINTYPWNKQPVKLLKVLSRSECIAFYWKLGC